MKKNYFVCIGIAVGIAFFFISSKIFDVSTVAQKNTSVQWEYCAITAAYIPAGSENQPVINGAVNVCYLQTTGCKNEEIKSELAFTKFLQEFRQENTEYAKTLAYNRAKDLALSRAVAKLGAEGWEMTNQPTFKFDNYIQNSQGNFTVVQGSKETKSDIYFKRLKQNNY
jgi:hypothetical protein